MSPVLVVARRELAAMFRAPLAYVFFVLFVIVAQLPHALTVFPIGQASATQFFDWLPWFIVVFSALVTMRSWAEERQDNTYEMLLTFPMRDRHLVLGKWIAAFAFLAFGIVGTAGVPIMLFAVGKPDPGPLFAGYLGALLLAAMSTAAGVFFSGITRSQLLAALLSLVVGFLCLASGTMILTALTDAALGGFGSVLRSCISPWSHYNAFTRGVVELLDVVYFVAWTVVFLHLNTLFLGLRRMSDSLPQMVGATALGLLTGMLTSRLVSEGSVARVDLTEDKLYTLSPGTLAILAQAQVPVQVRYYVSPDKDMPSAYKSLEREVTDRLNEIAVASHGKLAFSVLHMNLANVMVTPEEEAAEGEDEFSLEGEEGEDKKKDEKKAAEAKQSLAEKEKSVERRLLDKGVKPFTAQSFEATEVSSKLVYSTLGIAYREKDEEFITPITPERFAELEYVLANTVAKITRPRPPKIALVVGDPMDPQMKDMWRRAGQQPPDPYSRLDDLLRHEKFDVEKVELSAQQPMPQDYDALVVVNPARLDERQQWEIGRALYEGRPTLLAVQRFTWEYRPQGRQITMGNEQTDPGLDELLEANGLRVSNQYLMDSNSMRVPFPQVGFIPSPTHVVVTSGQMNQESQITQRLSSILYLWGTAIELDRPKLSAGDIKTTVLLSSSEKSWSIPSSRTLTNQDLRPEGKELKPFPLVALVEGQFKNPWQDKPRPSFPPKLDMDPMTGRPRPAMPDGPETPAIQGKGRMILAGCAQMWADRYLLAGELGDGVFLLNCLDALTLDENLLLVRSKQPTDRRFEKPKESTATFWTVGTLVLVPLAALGVGVFVAVMRFRRRETWNAGHGRWRP